MDDNNAPGWAASAIISSTLSTSLSGGAFATINTDPTRHSAHPSLPTTLSRSLRKYVPSTVPVSTLSAPSGVTSTAGAKV